MHFKSLLFYVLIGGFVVTNIVSCSSTKKLTATTPVKNIARSGSFTPITPKFDTWNVGRCKVSLTVNERTITVQSSLRMVKDSLISLSIQPLLGIEMYRADLTPDSITLIDRGNHSFFTTSYDFFEKKFGVSIHFADIQAILSNNLLRHTSIPTPQGEAQDSLNQWIASRNEMKIDYGVSKENRLIQTQITQGGNQSMFRCTYEQFESIAQQFAPMRYLLSVSSNQKHAEMALTYENVNVNTGMHPKPVNTSRYQRVSLSQILPF